MNQRRVLFLMGPASMLWRELGAGFEQAGHRVFKINVSLGDQIYWWRAGAVNFRGRRSKWRAFLREFLLRHEISDILYYGDRVFYHVEAQALARELGLNAIAIENGYLRPDWITLERGGMGLYSYLPDDPARVRQLAAQAPEPDTAIRFRHSFATEIVHEATYALLSYSWRILYPFYRFERYYDPLLEYLIALPFLLGRGARQRRADRLIDALVAEKTPCFVVALQLQGDQQILANSPYTHLAQFVEEVTASFARQTQAPLRLVFKQHPHDNHRENWRRVVALAARRHGVDSRVDFIDGGDLGKLLQHARGCVLVNSTVGIFALRLHCPTKVTGIAIYDMPGLTHQGDLDSFWRAPEPVDPTLVEDFVRVIAAEVQVKGSFFDPAGRRAAVEAIVRRVSENRINAPAEGESLPPRIEKGRAKGVPLPPSAEIA